MIQEADVVGRPPKVISTNQEIKISISVDIDRVNH